MRLVRILGERSHLGPWARSIYGFDGLTSYPEAQIAPLIARGAEAQPVPAMAQKETAVDELPGGT